MQTDAYASPCRVRMVHVRGLNHTRRAVVLNELKALEKAQTLGAIGDHCLEAAAALQSTGIFDSADLLVDAAPEAGPDGPLADIVVTVSEKKRLTQASTGVSTQAGEGSMDTNVAVRNLFGWAERIDLNMEVGQQKSSVFKLGVTRPRFLGMDAELSADVSKCTTTHIKHSSFMEKMLSSGVHCRIGNAQGERGMHSFGYVLEQRDICKLPPGVASWSVLQQRGLSLKSALSHTFALSRLDSPIFPTSGASCKLTTEVAGLVPAPPGDVRFLKQTLAASAFLPLTKRVTLGLQLQGGMLLPLGQRGAGGAVAESCISDRFYLGGPGSFWGFRTRGCGPRELRHSPTGDVASKGEKAPRDALGGDLMGVATASLSVALPGKLEESGMRAHAFASAGGLTGLAAYNAAGSFAPSMRSCVGVGLALPTSVGRVELNLTHVLRKRADDAIVRNGIQLGISPGY